MPRNKISFSILVAMVLIILVCNKSNCVEITENADHMTTMATTESNASEWNVLEHVTFLSPDEFKSLNRSGFDEERIFTLLFPFPWYHTWYFDYLAPAMLAAIDTFGANHDWLSNYTLHVVMFNDFCNPRYTIPKLLELIPYGIDVIFGMRCSFIIVPAGYILSYYDIPQLSTGSNDAELEDKVTYNTLIRLAHSFKYVDHSMLQMFQHYGWTRTAFVEPLEYNSCAYATASVQETFSENDIFIAETATVDEVHITDKQLSIIVSNLKERARIFVVCLRRSVMRRFLAEADRQGMISPDYAYFTFATIMTSSYRLPWGDRPEGLSDREWETRKGHFKHMKYVANPDMTRGQDQIDYMEGLLTRMEQPPFNKNISQVTSPVPDKSTLTLNDCVYNWLICVEESLKDGTNPRSGRNIFAKTVNKTFQGVTGKVTMDTNADRINDYWVWQLPEGNEGFEPVSIINAGLEAGQPVIVPYEDAVMEWGTTDGQPPLDTPLCGFFNENCEEQAKSYTLHFVIGILSVLAVILLTVVPYIYIRKKRYENEILKIVWKINIKDLEFQRKRDFGSMIGKSVKSLASILTRNQIGENLEADENVLSNIAVYKGTTVTVQKAKKPKEFQLTKEHLVELKQVKDMNHENVNSFIGAAIVLPDVYIVMSLCAKGSLQDIIGNDDIKLDSMFKQSLISDLANGMRYIQSSPIHSHGHLTSDCCLIDSRWVLKVSDIGLHWLKNTDLELDGLAQQTKELLWCAPELLRVCPRPEMGTAKGDVYSFGIIMHEILFRSFPYCNSAMSSEEILKRVQEPSSEPFRPPIDESIKDVDSELIELMKRSWSECPSDRPNFDEIKRAIVQMNKGRKVNIMDNMVKKLERYANNLEELVDKRTEELFQEKKKTDQLLYRMLPSEVAEQLKVGNTVPPELYDEATVYFSDIVGFTSLSSSSTPLEVVNLLNDLYTCFDAIIALHDVYKVETIGDAYMCVSGIPKKNGHLHAAHIANMALGLREAAKSFQIRHMPETSLNIRIGMHTGPCAAGVVGLTMPRYCLFGDTVNYASRMESNGEAMRLHLSEPAYKALVGIGGYDMMERGEIQVKGKGLVKTYWLEGKLDQ